MHRIELTPAYVLHTRPFQNTSLLIDLFSREHGRISAIARSARGPKSRYQGQLQLFTPLLISWSGKNELKTLGHIELDGMPIQLNQKALFCGFYLNELLTRLLHKEDPHPALFDIYHRSLITLEKNESLPITLRTFEKKLLDELGYGLPLKNIQQDQFYLFEPQQGFIPCRAETHAFLGDDLMLIANETFHDERILQITKKITRSALQHLLGNKPLHSRALF
jgi:DNA repair protein RecO (recombination protein O)